jgi:hypothetical protein
MKYYVNIMPLEVTPNIVAFNFLQLVTTTWLKRELLKWVQHLV